MAITSWTPEQIEVFKSLYPEKGKEWCMSHFSKSEGQVRSKASKIGLKARGVSEAWNKAREKHSLALTGRKRPDQAAVMNRLHAEGKLKFTEERIKNTTDRLVKWAKEHDHPRGSLGMKHTQETKEVISKNSKKTWESMNEESRLAHAVRASITARKTNASNRAGKSSWRAGWREIGQHKIYARSSWEANYARVLQKYEELGKIICWEHEPETFWFDGIKRGCMSYLPDFRVTMNDGDTEYHEVKGWMDQRSKTALNRMRVYHKNVKIVLIDKKKYMSVRGEWRYRIDDWED